jgi:hypothetical protein
MLNSVTKLIDNLSANSKEKEKLKSEVSRTIMEYLDNLAQTQKDIIITEAKGNWLQRSWRPIVMLAFAAVVLLGVFIPIPLLNENSPFWSLLEIGLGGYVIGRSAEKITTNITNLKKK